MVTRFCKRMKGGVFAATPEKGDGVDDETLSRISPYITDHVNRFGNYTLNKDTPAPDYALNPLSQQASG